MIVHSLEAILSAYDYAFPKARIAQQPASPRDSSKLMILDRATGKASEDIFRNIGKHLPEDAVLVLNETKVVPAKLMLRRVPRQSSGQAGGKVEALILRREHGSLVVWANRRLDVGETISLTPKTSFMVEASGREMRLKPLFPMRELDALLDRHGNAPLPPYIKHCPLTPKELRKRYQTVFAKTPGSIAAPTASLHFTPALLKKLQKQGIAVERITLHVHLGTFAPLTQEHLDAGRLHREEYRIDAATAKRLERYKKEGRMIVAVGTTVVRTLESASDTSGHLEKVSGETDLFIREGYRFRFVDAMITNFHVPKSSLLMLVATFAGRESILRCYRRAIRNGFRLFSFGDAMLLR